MGGWVANIVIVGVAERDIIDTHRLELSDIRQILTNAVSILYTDKERFFPFILQADEVLVRNGDAT